jgi:hypothetical protein
LTVHGIRRQIAWFALLVALQGQQGVAPRPIVFEDLTERSQVRFLHSSSATSQKYLIEWQCCNSRAVPHERHDAGVASASTCEGPSGIGGLPEMLLNAVVCSRIRETCYRPQAFDFKLHHMHVGDVR